MAQMLMLQLQQVMINFQIVILELDQFYWITGDSSGTEPANGGVLTTTGKALVMGF